MSGVGSRPTQGTCETSQVLFAGVPGGFSRGSPVFVPLTNWPVSYELKQSCIGYNLNVMRQSACLVFNPITVDNYAAFFNCTPVGRASDSMMAPT